MTPEQIEKIKIIKNIFVPSENLQLILDNMKKIRQLSIIDNYEHLPTCMLVTGETGVGKTTFIEQYMKNNPRSTLVSEEDERTIIPVLYCELPKAKHPKPVAVELLKRLGDPVKASGDANSLLDDIADLLSKTKVELIIIDEFQHAIETTNKEVLKEIGEYLKRLINKAKVPIAFFGMPWSTPIFEVNSQLKRRVRKSKFKIQNFSLDTFDEFQMFLEIVQEELPIEFDGSMWEDHELAFKLFAASSGNLSDLMEGIIMPAAIDAVIDNEDLLTVDHLAGAAEDHLDFLEETNPFNMNLRDIEAKQQVQDSYWNSDAPKNALRVEEAQYAKVKFSDLELKMALKKQ
ncbi:TniB family NTP-binding protein [Alteromonas sp. 5E99-2]|uniref:TniB family NTP-binding protein n=1 Tax=Alteromonas sp. 5E99-2 TaxID=2817683 RepID=UPI001A98AE7E|nr:TniB family NTP-binding protein [Alteromonas sp. 5E99-2]MBO1256692.1 TniB family NTP-binding protein [Alteromonas sp. 5E99-2]